MEVEEIKKSVGPVSTLVNTFVLNLMVMETVEILLERNIDPPIWASANVPGGDKINSKFLEEYVGRIKLL